MPMRDPEPPAVISPVTAAAIFIVATLNPADSTVRLYLREPFTFLILTSEASVPVALSERPAATGQSARNEITHGYR